MFKFNSRIDFLSTSHKIALRLLLQNPIDDKSALVKVIAWWHQTLSHAVLTLFAKFQSGQIIPNSNRGLQNFAGWIQLIKKSTPLTRKKSTWRSVFMKSHSLIQVVSCHTVSLDKNNCVLDLDNNSSLFNYRFDITSLQALGNASDLWNVNRNHKVTK